jgi:hypothetical protein
MLTRELRQWLDDGAPNPDMAVMIEARRYIRTMEERAKNFPES